MAKFTANDDFFRDLPFSPGVVSLVKAAADGIGARARASAPVATGAYRRGIVVVRDDTRHRARFRVIATDPKSMGVESRTGNLARAVKGAGRG